MARCFRPRALPMKWKFRRFITSRLIKLSRLDDMCLDPHLKSPGPPGHEKRVGFSQWGRALAASDLMLDLGYSWIFGGPTRSKQKLGNQSGRKKKDWKKVWKFIWGGGCMWRKAHKIWAKINDSGTLYSMGTTSWRKGKSSRAWKKPHGMLQYARLFPGFFEWPGMPNQHQTNSWSSAQ